jgi:protein TorT
MERDMKVSKRAYLAAAALALAATGPATAGSLKQWWPLKVFDASSGKDVPAEYVPLPKAEKPWNLCVLFPHLKDSFWLGADYGVVEEARRAGVNMTLYEAGGYENLNKQLSQFDDCLASHADAIIIGGVSEGGMGQKYIEAMLIARNDVLRRMLNRFGKP